MLLADQLRQLLLGDGRAHHGPARRGERQQRAAQETRPVLAAPVAVAGKEPRRFVGQLQCLGRPAVAGVDDQQLQAGPRFPVRNPYALEVLTGVLEQLPGETAVAQ